MTIDRSDFVLNRPEYIAEGINGRLAVNFSSSKVFDVLLRKIVDQAMEIVAPNDQLLVKAEKLTFYSLGILHGGLRNSKN